MRKYGDKGDIIYSLNTDISDNSGASVEAITIMQDDDNVFKADTYALKQDIYEQMIKDATFALIKRGKVSKIDGEILLHSHGIDNFFPKKTAREIAEIYGLKNTDVRARRYVVAKKVAREIRLINPVRINRKHYKEVRRDVRIAVRITEAEYRLIDTICRTKGQNISLLVRNILTLYLKRLR